MQVDVNFEPIVLFGAGKFTKQSLKLEGNCKGNSLLVNKMFLNVKNLYIFLKKNYLSWLVLTLVLYSSGLNCHELVLF